MAGYLRGQLVPSELLAGVLPSGQHPKGVLSHEERGSTAGGVVTAAEGSGKERENRRREGKGENKPWPLHRFREAIELSGVK